MEEKHYDKESIDKSHKILNERLGIPQNDLETMAGAFRKLNKALSDFGRSVSNLSEIQFFAKRLKYLNRMGKRRKNER